MNESVLWDSAILLIITSNSKKSDVKRTTGSLMVACKGKVREVHKPGSLATWEGFVKDGLKNIRTKKRRREEPAEDAVT